MSYDITEFLTNGAAEDLINEGSDELLDVENMMLEAVEEHSGFNKDLEDLQFYNQDHTNNLDNDVVDSLDPDNTESFNTDVGDDEVESGMEVVTISESAGMSLLEELLTETSISTNDLPDDEENPENPLTDFNEDDLYDTTNLEDY